MAGGFGSVISFMFTFFVVVFTFSAIFYSYEKQVNDNSDLIKSFEKDTKKSLNTDFNIKNPFYMSGRLNFLIENGNNYNLKYMDSNIFCFTFIDNSMYVKTSNLFFNILKHIPDSYTFIEKGNNGIFSSKVNYNNLVKNDYKFISCEGKDKYYTISNGEDDWWNSDWDKRKKIIITNNVNSNLAEYQIEINLNNSNFDFNLGKENEIRFLFPIKNSLILDLPFDTYSQNLEEYSSFSNNAYLGYDNSIEITDPLATSGVILDGLNFDGLDDTINISKKESLYLNNSLTYSSWIKWNGQGNTFANIFVNGGWQNSLLIVNDGGVNDNKILFRLSINGIQQYLYSNVTVDNSWHFISSTYDGYEMKIYMDSVLVGNLTSIGNVDIQKFDNYIGSEGSNFYFNGSIDEVKIFNTDLRQSEIEDLYHNNLRFRELDYYITEFNGFSSTAKAFVKIPSIMANSNVSIDMYYDNRNGISTNSDIKDTFSYTAPRTYGYIVTDRISATTGLSIFSLENNNTITVGTTNSFNLNELESTTLAAASINQYDSIKSKFLSQVEGKGDADNIITPISWASKDFYYRGFRKTTVADRFCMLSPFGSSFSQIWSGGVLIWNETITNTGTCISLDIPTANNLAINSTIPILVSYYGNANQDGLVFYPATNENLYGFPSSNGYVGAGPLGAAISVYRSGGTTANYALGAYGTASFSSGGSHGTVNFHELISTNGGLIGAIGQGDADGSESETFLPLKEFGTKFGSGLGTEYIVLGSKYPDANCSTYNSLGTLVTNIPIGTGDSTYQLYNYSFDVGNSNTYLTPNWKVECDKPVSGYFEEDAQGDETNLFSYTMMRQYVYPEPSFTFN